MARIFKNLFGDGYTIHHDNGDVTRAYKNITNDGFTTYRSKGNPAGGIAAFAMLLCTIGISFYAAGKGAMHSGIVLAVCLLGAFLFRNAAYLCWVIPLFAVHCRRLIKLIVNNHNDGEGLIALLGILGAVVCAVVLAGVVYYVSDENNLLMLYSLLSFIMPPILGCYDDNYIEFFYNLEYAIAIIATVVWVVQLLTRKR